MIKNIKILLALTVIIIVIATVYFISNDHTLEPFVQPKNINKNTQHVASQSEGILPTTSENTAQSVEVNKLLMAAKTEKSSQAKRYLPKRMTPIVLSEQELNILKEKSHIKQAEINLLIALYGENINDQDKKQALQKKVKILMAEYNELILPLALKAMEVRGNG